MRVVIALGGNALLRRGEAPEACQQQRNIAVAAQAIASVAADHEVIITHGNGPQVGMLALESERDPALQAPYPLDVIGAETDGMVGYWLQRELGNRLRGRAVATVLTQTVVDMADAAFTDPTKYVGQTYDEVTARTLAAQRHWRVHRDVGGWRRVVASPEPVDIVELPVIQLLIRSGVIVICAGGGGVPVARSDGRLTGVEAVVDKDRTAALLALRTDASVLVMLTDVPYVAADFGTPQARPLHRVTPEELSSMSFAAGSMGPKIEAACRFVDGGGGYAVIGRLEDAPRLVAGDVGTVIRPTGTRRRLSQPVTCLEG